MVPFEMQFYKRISNSPPTFFVVVVVVIGLATLDLLVRNKFVNQDRFG
jgi:hypothetical protein